MAVLSAVFLLISWLLATLFGSVGFIIANCCNMAARIYHRYVIRNSVSGYTNELQVLKSIQYVILCLLLKLGDENFDDFSVQIS